MTPDNATEVEGGLTRLSFVYPGGCFDLALPAEWKQLKSKEDFTRYGDTSTKCTTVFTRWDAAPDKLLTEQVHHLRQHGPQGVRRRLLDLLAEPLDRIDAGLLNFRASSVHHSTGRYSGG